MEGTPRPSVSRISVDDFAEATFSAVLRALDAREQAATEQKAAVAVGPIIYGIIAWPQGIPGDLSQ
jgi:hypothetical protein